jgi:fibronectin-binding autotransporter adhesin
MSGNRGGRRGGRACGVAGFRFALVVGVFALATADAAAQANVWAGATSSDWADGTNWSLGLVPTNAHDVDIPPGTPNPPIVGGATNAAAGTLSVQPAATLNLAAGASLTVAAGATVDGTLTFAGATGSFGGDVGGLGLLDAGGGAHAFGGSISIASLTFTGTPLYTFTAVAGPASINLAGLPDVAVNSANSVTFSVATTVAGGLVVSGAGAAVFSQYVVVTGAASVTNGSLQLDGAGAGMNTFSNGLSLAGGDVDADGGLDVVGSLSIGAGDTLTLNGVAALTAGGDVAGAGTLAAGGGSHQFTGSVTVGSLTFSGTPVYTYSATAGAATVSVPTSLPEVVVNAANDVAFTTATQVGGALTVTAGSATFSQALTVTGDVDVGAGGLAFFDAAAATNQLNGALTVTGSLTVQGDLAVVGLIAVAGTLALPTGALTASDSFGGAGQFDAGTGSHAFDGSFTVATLTFSGSPTYSFTAAATPGGATVAQATLPAVSASNTNDLTFSTTTSVQGALAMIGPGLTTFTLAPTVTGDVTVSNGTLAFDGGATLQGALSVLGAATATAAGDLDVATTVTLTGDLTMTAGDFSAGGTVQGAGSASFPGAPATQGFGASLLVSSVSFGAGATANVHRDRRRRDRVRGARCRTSSVASANVVVFAAASNVDGDLTKSGAGSAQFSDTITVTGAVTVNAGTVSLFGTGGGNDLQGPVTIAVGAALDIDEDTTIGGDATVNGTLSFNGGAELTANGDVTGTGSFSGDDGDHTFHGSFTVTTQSYTVSGGGPRYTFDPSVAPVTVSSATLPDVRVDGGFDVTFTAATLVEFDLDNQGTALGVFLQPVTVTGSVSGAFSFVGGATLGSLTVPLGTTTTFNGGSVTVNGLTTVDGMLDLTGGAVFNGVGNVVGGGTFNGGTGAHTFAADLAVANLNFTAPTTYTFTGAAGPASVTPNALPDTVVNNANDVAFGGTPGTTLASLTKSGAAAANFSTPLTTTGAAAVNAGLVNLDFGGGGNDLQGTVTVALGAALDVDGDTTFGATASIDGTLTFNGGASLDATGDVAGSGTFAGGSGDHTFHGSFTVATQSFSAGAGTPQYLFDPAAAPATVSSATLPDVVVDGAFDVTFTAATSVLFDLENQGTALGVFQQPVTVGGAVTGAFSFLGGATLGSLTVPLGATTTFTGGSVTVNGLTTVDGTLDLLSGAVFSGVGNVVGGGTFNGGTGPHTFAADLTVATLNFTAPTTYTFTAAAGPATVSIAALPDVLVSSANDVAFTGAPSIALDSLTVLGPGAANFAQYVTITGLTSVTGGGVGLNATGAGANSLAIASFTGGSLTAADDTNLSGALTVGPGFTATMTDPASTLTLAQGAGIGGTLDLTSGATLDAGGAVLGVGTLLAGGGSHTFGGSLTIATLTFTGTPTYLFTAVAAAATVSVTTLPAVHANSANGFNFTTTASVVGALTKSGAGTATFQVRVSVGGAVVVNGGLLSLDGTGGGANALMSTVDLVGGDLTAADDVTIAGATTLAAGTTFTLLNGAVLTANGDVTGAGTLAGGTGAHAFAGSLTSALTFSGTPIYVFTAVAGPATVTPTALPGLFVSSANDVTFTNATSVAGSIAKLGTGTATFSLAPTVVQGVTCTAGTLTFAAGATLQSALSTVSGATVVSAGDLTVTLFVLVHGDLQVTSGNFSGFSFVSGPGSASFAGAPSVHDFRGDLAVATTTFGVGAVARFTTVGALIAVSVATLPNVVANANVGQISFVTTTAVNGTFDKNGPGAANLIAACAISGAVTVNAGDLVVAAGPSQFQSTFTANGGELTLAVATTLDVVDDVTFAAGATIDAGTGSHLTAGGDWTAAPSVDPFAGTVQLIGATSTIGGAGPVNFFHLTVGNGSAPTAATAAAAIDVDGNLIVALGAPFTLGAFALDVAGLTTLLAGGTLSFTTGVWNARGTVAITGDFDAGSGAHVFGAGLGVLGNGTLTFPSTPYPVWRFEATAPSAVNSVVPLPTVLSAPATSLTFAGIAVSILGDLEHDGPGALALLAPTTVAGNAQFDGGTFSTTSPASLDVAGDFAFNDPATATGLVDLQVAGNYSAGAGFAPTSGTVLFDGAAQSLDSTAGNDELAFFVVRFAGAGVKSVVAPTGRVAVGSTAQISSALDMGATGRLDVEDDFTVDPGAVFAVGATSHSFGADFFCDGAINSAPGAFFTFDQSAFTPTFAAVRADATLAPLPNVIVSRAESAPGTPTHFVQFGQGLPLTAPVAGGAPVRTTGDFTLASGGVVIPTQLSATPLAASALQIGGSTQLFGGSMTFLGSDSELSVGGGVLYPTFGAPEVGTQIVGTANVVCAGSWFSNDRFAPSNGYVRFTGAAVGVNGQIGHRAPGGVVRFVALDVVDGGYALQSAVEALAATVAGGTGAIPILSVPAGASLASPRTADTVATGPTPVGAVKVGTSATSVGVLNVGDATTAGGALRLGANATLDVATGSAFRLIGAPGTPAELDRLAGGRYRVAVHGVVQARDFVVRGPARTGFVIDSDAQVPALPGETFGFGRGAFDQASTQAPAVLLDVRAAAGQTLVLPELRFDFDGVQTPPAGVFAATTAPGNNIPGTPGIGLGFVQFAQAAGTLFNVEIDPANQLSWTAAFTVVSNFAAVGSANKAVLGWHCVAEGPIQSFVVARGISAAGPFVDLPLEAAPGFVNYEYCDDGLAPGAYHYVLRQRNADGSVTDVAALSPATTSPAVYAATLASLPHSAVVGAGGFADVASAVASLAGAPYGAVYLAPGTYAAPTLSTVPAGGLSFVALPGGAVVFDTTAGPFTVATSPAGGVVELHGVEIGLAGSTGQALRIVAAKPVLLTDVVVRGSGPASAFVDATFGAAFQRATLVGGLEARNGAVVSFAGGSAAAAKADLGAKIRTAGAALGATSATNGGVVDAYAGVMPDLVAPRAAPVGLTFDVALSAAPLAPYVLLVAFGAAYQPLPGVAEMPLLLPPAATLPLWVGACDAAGLATFPVPLPADASVLGLTATFQAGVVGLGAAPLRLSTAAVVSVTP